MNTRAISQIDLTRRGVLCTLQLLFIASSVSIVYIMLRGHTHGRLVVQYDPASDCKVGPRPARPAPRQPERSLC